MILNDFRRANATELASLLQAVRRRTLSQFDTLYAALAPEYAVPFGPTVNPLLWELGHVGWFQTWWIGRNHELHRGAAAFPNAARSAAYFAQADDWYNSSTVAHASRWDLPLPNLAQTQAMLQAGLDETLSLLARAEPSDKGLYFFRLVYAHEAMHAEASCMMANEFDLVPQPELALPPSIELRVAASARRIKPTEPGFAFDNERGTLETSVLECFIDSVPVKSAVYATYLIANGRDEEAETASQRPANSPAIHVSLSDAQACAKWMGRRLPTEHEWHAAATLHGDAFHWGRVWEWTSSVFTPFPGFRADPYVDYSQPWFGNHQVLKGASVWTEAPMRHMDYRNFYLPERNDMLSGFRTVAL